MLKEACDWLLVPHHKAAMVLKVFVTVCIVVYAYQPVKAVPVGILGSLTWLWIRLER